MSQRQNLAIPNITPADVKSLLSVLDEFLKKTEKLLDKYKNEPADESIASQEKIDFPQEVSVNNAHYGGFLSMEVAADHLMTYRDSLVEPAKSIAPWTCVRGLLESCALASWFLDPKIDVKDRVGRYFAFRYNGLVQQIKLYRASGDRQENIKRVNERINKIERDALNLGYQRVLNKKGDIDGICQRMPSITDLIGITLDKEVEYRLLSAIAHGHHWATNQIGFRVIDYSDSKGNIKKGLKKHIEPMSIFYATNIALTAFAQVLWYIWCLYGWNKEEIKSELNDTFDRLSFSKEYRIWNR
jgi:hypothetical protein